MARFADVFYFVLFFFCFVVICCTVSLLAGS